MPATVATLDVAFRQYADIFNAHNDPTIGGNLDPNVIIHSVHKNEIHSGIADVQNYFTAQFSDNPYFQPGTKNIDYQLFVDSTGVLGVVSTIPGESGRWRDDNNTHGYWEKIRFTFQFRWDGTKWLLSRGVALP